MKILALEFSSAQRSVAAGEIGAGGRAGSLAEAIESGGRTVHAFAMIEQVLRETCLEREQIDCLVVGLGPGSYTGIRAAIALAQGWQLALPGVRTMGFSSVACLGAQARAEGWSGPLTSVIDAQRGEFYLAGFDPGPQGVSETEALRLATLAEATARQARGDVMIGPEVTKWFPNGRVLFPRAATLVTLAAGRTDFVASEKLEPIYLRETTFVKHKGPTRASA